MIKIRNLTFEYFDRDEEGNLTDMINAIRGINFDAVKGEFIGVCGKNGSGKSTFARILNRLLVPVEGTVIIGGKDALDEDNIIDIRRTVGMVFQNPDDQLIGSVVSEDVAFGAENLGVHQEELWDRVLTSIEQVGLSTFKEASSFSDRRINELSGGEKQKVAIAGVLAMKPQCIVLDESTSMLDPKSRWEIIALMKELNQKLGITIIMITHLMEELLVADTIYVLHQGKLVARGRKEAIFAEKEKLSKYGLDVPQVVEIRNYLLEAGIIRDKSIFTVDGLVARIKKEHPYSFELDVTMPEEQNIRKKLDPVNAILINQLTCNYGKRRVLNEVSLGVAKGEYVVIAGETGSGKSTLLKHIPGLIKTKPGQVYVDGLDVNDRTTNLQKLRCKIGYVFQYPEQQLFAQNVYEDVVFGPRNVGISEVEAEKRAYESISLVGLSEEIYDMPISKLSGGEKRRVALAGVLAMKPEYLILDEPLAGLDPEGKKDMLEIIQTLHQQAGITIIMVSHDVESVAGYADRLIVMNKGSITFNGGVAQGFYNIVKEQAFTDGFYNVPTIMQLLIKLRLAGMPVNPIETDIVRGLADITRLIR